MDIVKKACAYSIDEGFARNHIELKVESLRPGAQRLTATAETDAPFTELVLPCQLDERFAGFGEQFTQVDKRGRVIEAWVGKSTSPPANHAHGLDGGYKIFGVWYSSAGYAAIINSTRRWRVELAVSNPQEVVVRIPGAELDVTIVEGLPAEAIPIVTEISGRAPMAPPWAYGVWKSIRGDDEEVLDEARRIRDERLGCSAVWLDSHFQPESHTGFPASGTYSKKMIMRFRETADALHGMGFKVLTYVNPFMYLHTKRGDEAVEKGYVIHGEDGKPLLIPSIHPFEGPELGDTGLHQLNPGAGWIDLTNPEAKAWWQELLRIALVDEDADGWMQDFADGVPPGSVMHDGTRPDVAHNNFPVIYHEAAAEAIAKHKPDALFFGRPGFTGAQKHAKVFWPGDQTRDWSKEAGIGCIAPSGISMSLMGVGAWGPDIAALMGFPELGGGYGGASEDEELYVRFCQLGAMTPVMREHLGFLTGKPADSWTSELTTGAWRECAAWHISLFPYLYGLAHENARTGLPVMRGLMIDFPEDAESWTLTDEFMLGDALLCAPVIEKGAVRREVWLPRGGWIDIWSGERFEGPGWGTVDAPIDRWPVLQREGTVVPMLATVPETLADDRYAAGDYALELRVAPGGASERVLHDGTKITLDGDRVTVAGDREYREATVTGAPRT